MSRSPAIPVAALALVLLAPGAALAVPVRSEDPFEHFNRWSFRFSLRLDQYVVGPLAKLSTGLTPTPVVRALHNVIVNLSEPQVILNDLLQLRPGRAVRTVARLVINSTVGLAGTIDVAARIRLPHHPNGFGDTLGHYGVKSGPYLFIPVLGPSNFRDLAGAGVDQLSSPMVWYSFPYRTPINISLALAGGLEQRAESGPELQALLGSAADPYATLRSTYMQAREAEIHGQTALPPLPDLEGPGEALPSTATADPPPPPDAAAQSAPASPPPVSPSPVSPSPVSPGPAPAPPDAAAPSAAPADGPAPAPPPSPASP